MDKLAVELATTYSVDDILYGLNYLADIEEQQGMLLSSEGKKYKLALQEALSLRTSRLH